MAKGKGRESLRARKERALEVCRRLALAHPDAECALVHENPFQLLVATVLSAQCTDKKVNQVTPELFSRWPDPSSMAKADPEALKQVIHPLGFFNQKAKSLLGLSRLLDEGWGGQVPAELEELIQLPGVARKTANVVLGVAFGKSEGVVVDTHVRRISSRRLRLSPHDDPTRLERDLMKLLPREEWVEFSHRIIWHGRRICDARKPDCQACTISDLCPSAFGG